MGRIFAGIIGGLVLAGIIVFLYLWSGVFDVTAAQEPDTFDTVAAWSANRAIDHHAPAKDAVSAPTDRGSIERGLAHFGEMCAMCHGAPEVEPVEYLHDGMLPSPPDLADPATQERSDAELLWIVENGIRASGMPAFGAHDSRDELLEVVAAVRRLPDLSAPEADLIRERLPGVAGEHGHGMEPGDHHGGSTTRDEPPTHQYGDGHGASEDHDHSG